MKQCTKCNIEKDYSEFSKHCRKKDGYRSACKGCDKAYKQTTQDTIKTQSAKYYIKNKERINIANLKWQHENKDYRRQKSQEYYQQHKKLITQRNERYRLTHRDLYSASTAKYRARKLQATPHWLTEKDHKEIEKKYKYAKYLTDLTGEAWHVDHIHPLQGKNICGLHHPDNLQVIPGKENQSKSNKYKGY